MDVSRVDHVEWCYDATTVRWLRWLWYASTSIFAGLVLLSFLVVVAAFGLAFLDGNWSMVALFVLLALVGGPFSLLYLAPMLRDPAQRPEFVPDRFRNTPKLSRWNLIAGSLVGGAVLVVTAWIDFTLVAGVVVFSFLALCVVAVCSTRGAIDPDELVLSRGVFTADLTQISSVARNRLGPLVVFRFRYDRKPGALTNPWYVIIPVESAARATRIFEYAMVAGEDDTSDPDRSSSRLVRIVASTLGVVLLTTGILSVLLIDGFFGWYTLALMGLFAVLLIGVAVYEG